MPIKLWNAKKNRSKGASVEARQLNQYIDQAYTKLFQIYQNLKFQEKLITAKLIKARFTGDNEQAITLQNLIEYHCKKIENTIAIGTIRNFGVTENYLNMFLNKVKKTSDVYLKELDYKFLCDFENFLSDYWPTGHSRALSQNTIMKHIQRLHKMVTLAYHMEWIDKDPFNKMETCLREKTT